MSKYLLVKAEAAADGASAIGAIGDGMAVGLEAEDGWQEHVRALTPVSAGGEAAEVDAAEDDHLVAAIEAMLVEFRTALSNAEAALQALAVVADVILSHENLQLSTETELRRAALRANEVLLAFNKDPTEAA
jgi:hypothetical protein